jgi:hypothetical protein
MKIKAIMVKCKSSDSLCYLATDNIVEGETFAIEIPVKMKEVDCEDVPVL